MKKYYGLKGMSCGGCVSNVKKALMELPDVTEAEVQLKPQGVLLTMNKSIDTQVYKPSLIKRDIILFQTRMETEMVLMMILLMWNAIIVLVILILKDIQSLLV